MAWGQCGNFLSTYLKGVDRQDVSSTSKAAVLVAEDESGTSAAISSRIAAEVNGLDVLAKGIQDEEGNVTRFFVIRSLRRQDLGLEGSLVPSEDDDTTLRWKSLVSFTVHHDDPGALADALAVFKPYRLNLTSINARPSGVALWNYVFLVEIQGKRLLNGEGAVNAALRDLGKVVREWRWLGSWENKNVSD